ncbi:pyridoxamine 5'-phosphate oxidase family protein [Ciceribacter sp. L1K22]|uniref:HugZ family pyridoxamine 5'-phosphate oxidase n=1 Tax=Ciceribacter sp. L1K22 TaxID=2820275 RepID=UPI001ABED0F5|nr:pyridoxamine 5'-phosphate oxidase family protein [Ciceribacter sp. L1K22]MBO3761138.1 HugZ family protein [Ciceribacter sp. L1K22]
MTDKPSVIRETDEDARRLARTLVRAARYVALAVVDPETLFPSVSRVLVATDSDGVPVILVSNLSAHTRALSADSRCSLLAGEPGKGDPLAYPRLTVQCLAEPVDRDSDVHARLRARFLARHPKSKLYIDFPDFRFFRLVPQGASLNGGFGRAYILPADDLIIANFGQAEFAGREAETLQELMGDLPDLPAVLAGHLGGDNALKWQVCGLDMAGIDLISGDFALRWEFSAPCHNLRDIKLDLSKSAYPIP